MQEAKTRESSFELLRIIAQFMIVLYHIYLFFVYPATNAAIDKAIWMPLHIGVPLFVLISGYFGIKVSGKGLSRLIGQMFVYTVPLVLLFNMLINVSGGGKSIHDAFFFVSRTPYWFMRTYLCLYLFSPVLNEYFRNMTLCKRTYLIIALAFISIYIGSRAYMDPALNDGKNFANFIFIYLIGNTLRIYSAHWKCIKISKLIAVYIILNIFLVTCFCIFHDNFIGKQIFTYSFAYNSPILLCNSILMFMIIGHYEFKSKMVNYIASSSLAIYLLSSSSLMLEIIKITTNTIMKHLSNDIALFFTLAALSIVILFICVLIDKTLNPIWNICKIVGERAENTVRCLYAKYAEE